MALFLDHCLSDFGLAFSPLASVILGTQDGATLGKLRGVFVRARGGTGQAFKILVCCLFFFFASTFLIRMFLL